MSFMNWIVEELNDASDFFYSIYREVLDWIWPFWLAAEFFYDLSRVFNWLAYDFADFAEWVYDVWDRVLDILDWGDIRSLIRDWLYRIEDVVDWWYSWTTWIVQEIDDWWSYWQGQVQGWIAAAVRPFNDLLTEWTDFWSSTWPQWVTQFVSLYTDWYNFVTVTLPNLVDFTWLSIWWDGKLLEINDFLNTWLLTLAPFWEGWQEVRDTVLEFFADPLEWLWVRFTDWFLGPEG